MQLKNMIAALHSSRDEGTKNFTRNNNQFGWDTIVGVYKADLLRAKHGTTRRVPGLRYAYIVRDSWTRLNVLPAKIMQVWSQAVIYIIFSALNVSPYVLF